MRRAWRIAAGAFGVVSVVWAYQSWQLSLQDALGPGPGFFPFCLSLAGAALAIALIVKPPSQPEAAGDEGRIFPRGVELRRVLLAVAALIAVTALLDVLGYTVAVALFCLFLLYILGARSWWVIVVVTIAASFGVNELFSDLLKVPLPVGLFER